MSNPTSKFDTRAEAVNSLVCVGLDSDLDKLPEKFKSQENPQFVFNKSIIDATHEYVAAYKPNIAFYEARGASGLEDLRLTMEYLREKHPDIFTICDAKRGDIGNTNNGYIEAILDHLGFDAMTLHPFMGQESLQPFLDRADKGSIILCRTSNPGAGEFQNLELEGIPLWRVIARDVSKKWNTNNNCMLVVGATVPEEMQTIRDIAGDMTFLVPGIGAQGGSVEDVMHAGLNSTGKGLIINSSRGIIFSESPANSAKELRDEINKYRT